ncbi:MAG: DEAD/DEAH box helicase [Bacilli bacterium]|nr:DEAD/DEAH box helicase [Bacilli bacterium]
MKFVNYHFKDYINKGLVSIGFIEATKIQDEVIPRLLKWESVIGKSETGSGKTHAFLLPILQNLDEEKKEVQVVIISPTRELATQLYDEIIKITKFSDFDVRLYVGGTDREVEIKRLDTSQPQIVVGTIGKIKDLSIDTNVLKIYTAKTVIIDEADMVFEKEEIEYLDKVFAVFDNLINVASFSATIPSSLVSFLNKYFIKHELIDLSLTKIGKDNTEYIFIPTKNKDKNELLLALLKTFTPFLVLIFANTKNKVDEIASFLGSNNYKVTKLTGDLEARERKQVLKRIKDGNVQYVVASDIASRGLDINGVSHVINYELPSDLEFFIHRVGRTGRFDYSGTAISFYDFDDDKYMLDLKKKGLNCVYMNLVNDELIKTNKRTNPHKSNRVKKIEEDVHLRTPMPKKVKPGYKKKRLDKIERKLKYMKRRKIDEMFFKNIHKQKAKENADNEYSND